MYLYRLLNDQHSRSVLMFHIYTLLTLDSFKVIDALLARKPLALGACVGFIGHFDTVVCCILYDNVMQSVVSYT